MYFLVDSQKFVIVTKIISNYKTKEEWKESTYFMKILNFYKGQGFLIEIICKWIENLILVSK